MKILRWMTEGLMHLLMWGMIVGTAIIWKKLPGEVPTKYNLSGEITRMGDKKFLLILIGVVLLVYGIHQIIIRLIQKVKGVSLTDELEKAAEDICMSLWCVDFGAMAIVAYVTSGVMRVEEISFWAIGGIFLAMSVGFVANIIRWFLRKK